MGQTEPYYASCQFLLRTFNYTCSATTLYGNLHVPLLSRLDRLVKKAEFDQMKGFILTSSDISKLILESASKAFHVITVDLSLYSFPPESMGVTVKKIYAQPIQFR